MPQSRLTTDAVLKMAHATAVKYANAAPADRVKSPDMLKAIDQVWSLVKGRLSSTDAEPLDDLIQRITGKAKDEAAR
jgi:hypothetical protein